MTERTLDQMYPILRFFNNDHLPSPLREISEPFKVMAWDMVRNLPYCPETSAGLRKLLEAKDCAVRAGVEPEDV